MLMLLLLFFFFFLLLLLLLPFSHPRLIILGIPIYLSEYFENGAQLMADKLAVAVDQGANAVTYWQYVDRDYTKQDGAWAAWPGRLVTQVILWNVHI